jgi:uncharacterized spore protein YtfJ
MANHDFIEKLASQFGQNASVKNVYGEPIIAGDKTIIPVAQIAIGIGGGYGQGKRKNVTTETEERDRQQPGEGAGGGGGMYAKPKGVYEITPTNTRFIPASNTKSLLLAAGIGFILRGWLYRKSRNK